MDPKLKSAIRDASFWAALLPILVIFLPDEQYARLAENPEAIGGLIAWIGGHTYLRKSSMDHAFGGE